ncbi:MAG: type IV pilus assembly protein PilW [Oleispira sp.]|jgi:type IV pilus assembly protein PilW
MNNNYTFSRAFTLIELMITLVLSLMITYAIAQVLISSNRTSVTSDGMSQSQETGRFVMSYLANHIRGAGLNSTSNKSSTSAAFVSCPANPATSNLAENNACIEENGGGEDQDSITNAGIHGDRLALSRIAPGDNLVDCTGSSGHRPIGADDTTPLTPYAIDDRILNTFWVEFDETSTLSNLMCQGFLFNGVDVVGSSPAQAIANGVEAIHLLYGEALSALPPSGERNVNRYVPAAADPAAPVIAREVQDWNRVYAVKASVLTRSLTDVTNSNTLRRYILANAAPYDMTDSVSRQVFTSTFVINNYR